jgi:hypothetical protein
MPLPHAANNSTDLLLHVATLGFGLLIAYGLHQGLEYLRRSRARKLAARMQSAARPEEPRDA